MTTTLQLVLGAGTTLALAAALGACVFARRGPGPMTAEAGPPSAADPPPDTVVAGVATASDGVPPIDVAARHVRYQTATFALG